MRSASAILPAGQFSDEDVLAEVELDFDARYRRRAVLTAGRLQVLLNLAQAAHLRDGDGLALDGGGVVRVRAAPERLVEIAAATPRDLVRIAWHLGNRHLPTQFLGGTLRIREDHVIARMLKGLGATVTAVEAAFDPEGGAYGEGRTHDHGHGAHDHGHG